MNATSFSPALTNAIFALLITIRHSSRPLIAQSTPSEFFRFIPCSGGGPSKQTFLKHLCNTLLQGQSLSICHHKLKYLLGRKKPIKFFTCYIKWVCCEQIQDRSILLNTPSAKVVNKSHQVSQCKKKQLWLDPTKQVAAKPVSTIIHYINKILSAWNYQWSNSCIWKHLHNFPFES